MKALVGRPRGVASLKMRVNARSGKENMSGEWSGGLGVASSMDYIYTLVG